MSEYKRGPHTLFWPPSRQRLSVRIAIMSGSGKGLLGLWLYRQGEDEWKLKDDHKVLHSKTFTILTRLTFRFYVQVGREGN